MGTCSFPPIGPHLAESVDLTDPVPPLPPPALSFGICASPLGYRPHSVPPPHPPPCSRGSRGFSRPRSRLPGQSRHQYIRYVCFSFLPSSPLLRLHGDYASPPSTWPATVLIGLPVAFAGRSATISGISVPPKRNLTSLARYQSTGEYPLVYRPIAWSLRPRYHPPANCDADISGIFVPPSRLPFSATFPRR